ncbi:MAG: NUDIX-like domain-containing protein, partial [Pseudomonadota bacterium]
MLIYPAQDYSAATGFGGNTLDRMSERREDEPFLAQVRGDPRRRAILLVGERVLLDGASALHSRETAERLGVRFEEAVFLGSDAEGPIFAAAIEAPAEAEDISGPNTRPGSNQGAASKPREGLTLCALRPLAVDGILSEAVLGAVGQARGVLGWHARHQFCANCGAPTVMAQAGMRRDC